MPRRDLAHVLTLAVVDSFAMYEAFVAAYSLRAADPHPFAQYMSIYRFAMLAGALTPVWIACFAFAGLYSVHEQRVWPSELGRILIASLAGIMLLVVVDYMRTTSPIFPGRSVPVYTVFLGAAFAFTLRMLVRGAVRALYARGIGTRSYVLIGTTPAALRIASELQRPRRGYRLVAVVSAEYDGGTLQDGAPIFRSLQDAVVGYDGQIDEVIQADDSLGRDEVAELVSFASGKSIAYRFVPDRFGVFAAASTLTTLDGIPLMRVGLTALDGWGAVAKRAFDLVGSTLLALVFSPIFAAVALAVKLTDREGPVLYRQERVGRAGTAIRVAKFRTMRWEYSTGPGRPFRTTEDAFRAMGRLDLVSEFAEHHKVADDPRITAVGRFLRRTSLDELPQLFASLRGDLSLIGPRPVTPEELDRYGTQQVSFLALKPGITGLWQVSGRSDISYEERVKLDIFYIENWSLRLDLSILARTTTAVLGKRGAY